MTRKKADSRRLFGLFGLGPRHGVPTCFGNSDQDLPLSISVYMHESLGILVIVMNNVLILLAPRLVVKGGKKLASLRFEKKRKKQDRLGPTLS